MISKDELKFLLPEYVRLKLIADKRLHDKWQCPFCGSGTRNSRDSDGAFTLFAGTDNVPKWHCMSCDRLGDVFDLIAFELNPIIKDYDGCKDHGVPFRETLKKAEDYYNDGMKVQTEDWSKQHPQSRPAVKGEFTWYLSNCRADLDSRAIEYLKGRGFTLNDIHRFGLGYDRKDDSITIPYDDDAYYCVRRIDNDVKPKYSYPAGISKPLWGAGALKESAPCFVCEGQIDALSLMKVGANAVSIGGVSIRTLTTFLAEHRPSCTLILSIDNDCTGMETTVKLEAELRRMGLPVRIADWSNKHVKDCNEYLTTDMNKFMEDVRRIINECNQYDVYGGVLTKTRDLIRNVIDHGERYMPTGYKMFDDAVGGGLPVGLTCFGAVSSMGKSAWMIETMLSIAMGHNHVMYFSLEMTMNDLVLRMLSGMTYRADTSCRNAIPYGQLKRGNDRMHWSDEQNRTINTAYDSFYDEPANYMHVFTNSGAHVNGRLDIEKIKAIIEATTLECGTAPIVLIDYLQLIPTMSMTDEEKMSIDKNITDLKALAVHFNTAIMLISSLNRESYEKELGMSSFLGSSSIEYGSDLLFVMQPQGYDTEGNKRADNLKNCKRLDARYIEIKLLKNRSGKIGKTIPYKFVAPYNVMLEGVKGDNKDIHNESQVSDDNVEIPVG